MFITFSASFAIAPWLVLLSKAKTATAFGYNTSNIGIAQSIT